MFVEAFLAHPSVEVLDQTVLHGFALCDVVPIDFALLLPLEHRVTGQFGPVVADDEAGVWAFQHISCVIQQGQGLSLLRCHPFGHVSLLSSIVCTVYI